jgi:DNA repair protein RadA
MATATKPPQDTSFKIEDLPGVGSNTADRLRAMGYADVKSIAMASPDQLVSEMGMGKNMAETLVRKSRDVAISSDFVSCDVEYTRERKQTVRINTGSSALNGLLGGGVELGKITEAYGSANAGKTQLGLQLAINLHRMSENYVTAYIDTENTFTASRVHQIAELRGMDPKKVLNSIKLVRTLDTTDLSHYVEKVQDLIQGKHDVRLVIIDSLLAPFRSEFLGREVLAERQQRIASLLYSLKKYAQTYNFAVYFTNQVITKPDQMFGDPTTAAGGNVVSHYSHYRLYLRNARKGTRVAKLTDSSNMPEGEVAFEINDRGIGDILL